MKGATLFNLNFPNPKNEGQKVKKCSTKIQISFIKFDRVC